MTNSIALLVVHGIGSQRRGVTLAACTAALQRAYPTATLLNGNNERIPTREISTRELDEAILRQSFWQVHLYEVYWAHILAGPDVDSSFSKFLFDETTWFPWFNWKRGLLPHRQYSRLLLWASTTQMWLLSLVATIIYEIVPKRFHSTVLDQIVADVWNYTHSLGGSLQRASPVYGAGEAIAGCFRQTAHRAHQDGCGELQIIAHSLGTVIAYNALTRYRSPAPNEAPTPITHLYTIGSPLEKFLFIWTRLLRPSLPNPEIQIGGVAIASGPKIQWKNFYSPLDLVSGKLKRFHEWGRLENKRIWGLGGPCTGSRQLFSESCRYCGPCRGSGWAPATRENPLGRAGAIHDSWDRRRLAHAYCGLAGAALGHRNISSLRGDAGSFCRDAALSGCRMARQSYARSFRNPPQLYQHRVLDRYCVRSFDNSRNCSLYHERWLSARKRSASKVIAVKASIGGQKRLIFNVTNRYGFSSDR